MTGTTKSFLDSVTGFPQAVGDQDMSVPGSRIWNETTLTRSSEKRLMLFSGSSNLELAQGIAQRLGIRLGESIVKEFANGETYIKFDESVRGADVFLVQSPNGVGTINDQLMELLVMIDAAKLASVHRITALIPWFPYSRQDKKVSGREPITARLIANLLETAGVHRVLSMDLHTGQLQGFFNVPVDHMTAVPILAQYFRDKGVSGEGSVVVSPDAGGAKRAKKFADKLDTSLAILTKERPSHNVAEVTNVIGNVRGKVAIMIVDMIDTAGTLCAGAQALIDQGATTVYACSTHAVFSGPALQRLADSVITEVVVTDTIPVQAVGRPDNITVLSVAGVLADTIRNVFCDESVSSIFGGENQLF
ncbi:MAG: Ribose-phosphate pyrophosphokinae [Thermoleophilia bacterium]|nr:Ribose-phosphate pyrophosphokinae [Thermoleophilia bacterium]